MLVCILDGLAVLLLDNYCGYGFLNIHKNLRRNKYVFASIYICEILRLSSIYKTQIPFSL